MSESSTLDLTLRLGSLNSNHHPQSPPPTPSPLPPSPPPLPRSSLSSPSVVEGDKEEDQSRPQKRPRMKWTPELHKKFVEVVDSLGEFKDVPKNIEKFMHDDGVTRSNISSHLQKYRNHLKKMQRNSNGESGNPGSGERNLTSHVSFRPLINSSEDQVVPFMPLTQTLHNPHMQQQGCQFGGFLPYRQFEYPRFPILQHFQHQSQLQQEGVYLGASLTNVGFKYPYLGNQSLMQAQRIRTHEYATSSSTMSQLEGTGPVTQVENGHKALQLFPTRDD